MPDASTVRPTGGNGRTTRGAPSAVQEAIRGWAEAAAAYRLAWGRDRQDAAALYLCGHALVRSGKEKEGRTAIERARWQPLGDEARRYTLAEALKG